MKKRIPILVAAGFSLLLVLGLATSLFLLHKLESLMGEAREIDVATVNLRAAVRELRSTYLEMGQDVGIRLLDSGTDFATQYARKLKFDEDADRLLALALRSTRSTDLRRVLLALQTHDHEVTNPLEEQVLKATNKDLAAATALYLTRYLPAQRKSTRLADLALRLAVDEVAGMHAQSEAKAARAESLSRLAIALFAGLGLAAGFILTRWVAAAEGKLRASEVRFRSVTQSVGDAIISSNAAGNIIFWNSGAENIFGHREDGVLGQPLAVIMPERFREMHRAGMKRVQAGGEARVIGRTVELVGLAKDGREFPIELTLSTWRTGEGVFYTGIIRDITERKRAEEALQAAKASAEAANRAKSEFLANMSHEIRTPMNGILGMTGLVLDTDLNREQRDYLGMAKSSAHSLLGLLNDILDFSKIEAGKLDLEAIDFNLRETVAHMLKPLVFRAGQKRLELVTKIAPGIPEHLIGDPLRLRQILINFADNAIKFTERGSITVKVSAVGQSEGGQCLHFAVTDTGIGIPAEKQGVIFEAFAQVDGSTTRNYGGTGLGLAIASHLVQQMRGKIWVESKVGEGTAFHFTAWFGVGPDSSLHEAPALIETPAEIPGAGPGLRILLAEDNAINRALATGILTKRVHSLVHAVNGREAVELACAGTFDLIFMDVQIPEMDGLEATRRIRALEQANGGPRTPIVAMTAHAMTGDRERCLAAGMDDYLSKPLEKTALLALLARIAAGRRAPAAHGAFAPGIPAAAPASLLPIPL